MQCAYCYRVLEEDKRGWFVLEALTIDSKIITFNVGALDKITWELPTHGGLLFTCSPGCALTTIHAILGDMTNDNAQGPIEHHC